MNTRELKGLEIASSQPIIREGNIWIVPSQSSSKKYTVNLFIQTCTCADFESHRSKCKHIHAAEAALQYENGLPLPIPEKHVRPTYKQEWHAYNLAQTNEKAKFQELLYELCRNLEEPLQHMGRPRLRIQDALFALCFKVYSTISGRRFNSDLREAHARGYLSKLPSYNSIFDYFQMESLTPYLKQLIVESSLPLKSVEFNFAVDSSGFCTGQYNQWLQEKYGASKIVRQQHWLKVHLMCGVKTNVVTSVEITHNNAGDSLFFSPLVEQTASNFVMNEVSADKAYSSGDNLKLVVSHAAQPYIPFRSNTNPQDKRSSDLWKRMYHLYMYNQDEFMRHYHRRSNVETTFSMIKAKFGERLRSKSAVAQTNEVLCKVLCHNLCCVVQSIYELGIEPNFWSES